MTISAILFDTDGVLYHRPRADRHLASFLEQHGLTLRHHKVLDRALRAARFDVRLGRITREMFYDAVLRVHGLEDETLFPVGRDMLVQDAADIELFPGVRETLEALYESGLKLAAIADSAHPARDITGWLAGQGVSLGLWATFAISCEVGQLKSDGALFDAAIDKMGADRDQVAYVGHTSDELARAAELGLTDVAFMPDDPAVETMYTVSSFYGLQDLFLD
ncbi:MAG: HAD family hydrolase [Chloroflexi bacterium]|nr:HAD family hydrolase [Chloroflexota bacterium]